MAPQDGSCAKSAFVWQIIIFQLLPFAEWVFGASLFSFWRVGCWRKRW